MVYREFATPPETYSKLQELQVLAGQLWGIMTNSPTYTDNASVSLAVVGPDAMQGAGTNGGSSTGKKLLLAMSETPAASYLVDPDDLSTLQQVCGVFGCVVVCAFFSYKMLCQVEVVPCL